MNQNIAQNIFIHHVLFYLKNHTSVADKNKLLEGLQKLATIECIRFSDIGTPAATNRSVIERDYTYSWLCIFNTAEEEMVYQGHPIHDEFRNNNIDGNDNAIIIIIISKQNIM